MGDDGVERGHGAGEQWFGEVKLELGLMWAAGRERDGGQRTASWFLVEGEPPGQSGPRSQGCAVVAPRQHLWSFPSTASHPISCLPLPSPLSISDPEQQFRSGQSITIPWSHPLEQGGEEPQRGSGFPRPLSDLGQSWEELLEKSAPARGAAAPAPAPHHS